jgi:CrcB protein
MNRWIPIAAVAIGGGFGAVTRFLVANWFVQWFGTGFPWGTFTINITGALCIGFVLQLAQTRIGLHPYARAFVVTGVLGGYTTFSTYAFETYTLSREAFSSESLWYGLGSLFAGVAAAYLGVVIARATLS